MLKPKSKTKFFLPISSCIPSPILANCHINFSSKPNNLYFIYVLLSLSKLPPHIHSLFIFTSSFCEYQLLSPSICSSQFSRLRFLLQIQVHGFLFINFFFYFFLPSLFFPKISLLRYEKFSVFTFWPGWNGTIFKTLVHAVSELCRRLVGEAKKRKEKKRHRSDTSTSVMRKHSSSSTSSGHRPLF